MLNAGWVVCVMEVEFKLPHYDTWQCAADSTLPEWHIKPRPGRLTP